MAEVHVQKGEFLLENWRTHCETGNHVTFLVSDDDLEPFKLATINKGKQVGQRYSFFLVQIGPDEQPLPPPPPVAVKPPKPETKEQKAVREAAEFAAKTGDLLGEQPAAGVAFEAQPDGSMARTIETTPIGEALVAPAAPVVGFHDTPFGVDHGAEPDKTGTHRPHFPDGLTGLAVQWSGDEGFHEWLAENFPTEWDATGNSEDYPKPSDRAKAVICSVCAIKSRTELVQDERAARVFDIQFRTPYSMHMADPLADDDEQPPF